MRAVQTCDFCDRTAVGTFEIVPDALEPTESEQRRAVLCESCHTRLETLLDPLIDRLEEGEGDQRDRPQNEDAKAAAGEDRTEIALETRSEGSAIGFGSESSTTMNDDEQEAADALEGETDQDRTIDGAAAAAGDATATPVDAGEAASTADESGDQRDAESRADSAADEPRTEPTTKADGSVSSGTENQPATAERGGTADRDRPPASYGKVLRLLRNREFPMARSDVEGLAAGAYDLEGHEVDAIIEHAIEQGKLVEDSGTLRRP